MSSDEFHTQIEVVKASDHGLGHLLNPEESLLGSRSSLEKKVWERVLARAKGIDVEDPWWLDLPAVGRLPISSNEAISAFTAFNQGRSIHSQVKPFGFAITVFPLAGGVGLPRGIDPLRFHPVAPYEPNASKWPHLQVFNLYDPGAGTYVVTTRFEEAGPSHVVARTYRDVIERYMIQPESKLLSPDRKQCDAETAGLLQRRSLRPAAVVGIGKQSNELDDRLAGIRLRREATLDMTESIETWSSAVIPVLSEIGLAAVAKRTGLSQRRLRDVASGATQPHVKTRLLLLSEAARYARKRLRAGGAETPTNPLDVCLTYCTQMSDSPPKRCDVCGDELTGRQRNYCTSSCRQIAYRRRLSA